MIAIVDYGMGNLRSVEKGFEHAGVPEARTTSDRDVVKHADGIVLPGVGAFRDAEKNLRKSGLTEMLVSKLWEGVPFLGICLGMQLLADVGKEDGEYQGLGLVHGTCEKLSGRVKLPHIGWNTVSYSRPSRLFEGIPDGSAFYFVHSYYLNPNDPSCIIGETEYGSTFTSAVEFRNLFAVQFHPEKSSEIGLKLLSNFGAIVEERGTA